MQSVDAKLLFHVSILQITPHSNYNMNALEPINQRIVVVAGSLLSTQKPGKILPLQLIKPLNVYPRYLVIVVFPPVSIILYTKVRRI